MGTLKFDAKNKAKVHRVLDVPVLGEIFGLHTLSGILSVPHIKGNNLHKTWKGANYGQVQLLVDHFAVDGFEKAVIELAQKGPSAWAGAQATIVVDDSIFKQWLKNMPRGEAFAKFFSGQYRKTVYGLRITLIGAGIGDRFCPPVFAWPQKGQIPKKWHWAYSKK